MNENENGEQRIRLALIQTRQNALYRFDKPDLTYTRREAAEGQREMIAQNLRLMREAPACDLMVTTEAVNFAGPLDRVNADDTALIGETFPDLTAAFSEIARDKGCYVAAGLYCREADIPRGIPGSPESVGSGLRNALWLFDRTGEVAVIYSKIHLTDAERTYLRPGRHYVAVDTDCGRLGLAICWDMQFPETCRTLADMGADLIIAPTWGWESAYGNACAYENGVFVAAAMAVPFDGEIAGVRTPSQIISPEGRILAEGSRTEAEAVLCEMPDPGTCRELREMRLREQAAKVRKNKGTRSIT